MKTEQTNLIHIVDLQEQKIKPFTNIELMCWFNVIAETGQFDKKRYLMCDNQQTAEMLVRKLMD